jgi:hypothetical protein
MSRDFKVYLENILEAARKIHLYTAGLSFEAFCDDHHVGQRLGGSHQPLHHVKGLDHPLVEERRMADRLAAVAGLGLS